MQLTIETNNKNPLLGRTEVQGKLTFTGATPSNADVQNEIAKQLKVDAALVVVKHVHTVFSSQEASVEAVAYDSAQAQQKAEKMTKHLRKKAEEEAKIKAEEEKRKAEEAAKKAEEEKAAKEAEAAAQAPAEEKTEDSKEESKEESQETKEGEQ